MSNSMRTVGEILKKERERKNIDFDKVEKEIKIRKKFLSALEENDWGKLPSLPYIKGFIRSYSQYLSLDPEEALAVFRRQFLETEKRGLLPEGLSKPINENRLKFTPQTAVSSLIAFFLLVFFGYIFFQYRQLNQPPPLTINSPQEGEIIKGETVRVSGETDPDATITVDNEKIAVSSNGSFSTSKTLPPGINTILIEAVSKQGKKRQTTRTVNINPSKEKV